MEYSYKVFFTDELVVYGDCVVQGQCQLLSSGYDLLSLLYVDFEVHDNKRYQGFTDFVGGIRRGPRSLD